MMRSRLSIFACNYFIRIFIAFSVILISMVFILFFLLTKYLLYKRTTPTLISKIVTVGAGKHPLFIFYP